jgi:predicted nucleic acid-binding protein
MPVEPGIVDTNVLVYALDADATQHASSRALLEAGRAASVTLYVTSQIICEFYSVVTNPRRVANPCSPAAALAAISSLLGFMRVLPVPAHTVEEFIRLLRRRPVTGGDIFDLQILATMNVNGIPRIYTFNTADFASFPEIVPLTP